MKYKDFYKKLVRYSWEILAALFILWGVFAFLTPFTPASWLFFVGLFIIFGRKRTQNEIVRIIGKKWFKKFKIKEIIEELPKEMDHKL